MITTPVARVYLPMIVAARDLDARLVLAVELARRGFESVIGYNGRLGAEMAGRAPGVFVSPTLIPMAAARLQRLRSQGYATIGWDEEGLVYPDPVWYMRNRVAEETLEHLDHLVTWGPQGAADLSTAFPDCPCPVSALGNPRGDLLRSPLVSTFADRADEIRQALGPYVLVNTNFDLVNHADGEDALFAKLREGGRIATDDDELAFRRWAVVRQTAMDSFMGGMASLAKVIGGRSIVIRPHPSEDLQPWSALAEAVPAVRLRPPDESVVPWILGCDAMLHSSCTTAVEAYLLRRPAIAFAPSGRDASMESPLPNDLSVRAESWERVLLETERLLLGWDGPDAAQEAAAARHLSATDGDLAAARIADLIKATPVPGAARPALRPSRLARIRGRLRAVRSAGGGTDLQQRQPDLDGPAVFARVRAFAAVLEVDLTPVAGRDGSLVIGPSSLR